MTDKRARVLGFDHPITIERNPSRVIVLVAGRVIADTHESGSPSVGRSCALQKPIAI